jgi:DNA-binding transcriptional LysR family regulator
MDADGLLDGRLKLRHLTLVTAIAEHGSVTRAAGHLHLPQPVVTRGLRELEAIIGAKLFDRGPRGVSPTAAGEVFVSHAQGVIAQLRQAGRHVAELTQGEAGDVTVGTHLVGTDVLLPNAIARAKRERPRLTIVIDKATPDVLATDLAAGRIDLIVGRLTPAGRGGDTTQIRLYTEPIRLVTRVGHPALKLTSPELADLVHFPWILPVTQTSLRHEIEDVFFEQGLPLPADRVECTSFLTLRTLLLGTDAIGALPLTIAETETTLATLATPLPSVHRRVGVTLPANRTPTPGTALLLAHLRAAAADVRAVLPAPAPGPRRPAAVTGGRRRRTS